MAYTSTFSVATETAALSCNRAAYVKCVIYKSSSQPQSRPDDRKTGFQTTRGLQLVYFPLRLTASDDGVVIEWDALHFRPSAGYLSRKTGRTGRMDYLGPVLSSRSTRYVDQVANVPGQYYAYNITLYVGDRVRGQAYFTEILFPGGPPTATPTQTPLPTNTPMPTQRRPAPCQRPRRRIRQRQQIYRCRAQSPAIGRR